MVVTIDMINLKSKSCHYVGCFFCGRAYKLWTSRAVLLPRVQYEHRQCGAGPWTAVSAGKHQTEGPPAQQWCCDATVARATRRLRGLLSIFCCCCLLRCVPHFSSDRLPIRPICATRQRPAVSSCVSKTQPCDRCKIAEEVRVDAANSPKLSNSPPEGFCRSFLRGEGDEVYIINSNYVYTWNR